jgi:uncharacterized protein (TIGR03118 family)
MASVGGANFIYATNFRDGVVEVYDSSFSLAKSFTDSTVPDGFAPFGIQNINGKLFITFAKQNAAKHDNVAGPPNGFVTCWTSFTTETMAIWIGLHLEGCGTHLGGSPSPLQVSDSSAITC